MCRCGRNCTNRAQSLRGKQRKMTNQAKTFLETEDGAITVDWVVLSAAVIGMGMLVLVPIAFSTESSTQGVAYDIGNMPVGYDN